MRFSGSRALSAAGFSVLFALTAACGGSKPEAKVPTTDSADAPRVGSGAPDPSPESTSEPPKTTAVSSTNDGSDIIPPFTASKDPPGAKKAAATKGAKKSGAKPKKKSTQATARSGAT